METGCIFQYHLTKQLYQNGFNTKTNLQQNLESAEQLCLWDYSTTYTLPSANNCSIILTEGTIVLSRSAVGAGIYSSATQHSRVGLQVYFIAGICSINNQ